MRHEELSAEFLSEFDNSGSVYKLLKNILRLLEMSEIRYDTDFCQFNDEQIGECLPGILGVRSDSAEVILSWLRRYIRFCASRGITVSDAIVRFKPDLSDRVRESFVKSPEHLLFVLDYVFGNSSDNSMEHIYRTYLWLAYLGLDEDEAARVTSDDVDFKKGVITLGGQEFQMYDESLADIKCACDLTEFMEVKKSSQVRFMPRMPGRQLLRGKNTKKTVEQSVATTLRQMVSRYFSRAIDSGGEIPSGVQDSPNVNLSYRRARLSGIFYKAYNRELLGLPHNIESVAAQMHEKNRSGGDRSNDALDRRAKYTLTKGLLDDYDSWKKAFGL